MSDREDRKLVQIPVGQYAYRHEAEFAAGFLEDAGIPYRLQIDDPALGMAMSGSATLWVAAMDERRARELLDVEGEPPKVEGGGSEGLRTPRGSAGSAVDLSGNIQSDLTLRQRLVALTGSLGALGVLAVDAVSGVHTVVPVVIAVIAAALLLIALMGRAPGRIGRVLSALSGDAP